MTDCEILGAGNSVIEPLRAEARVVLEIGAHRHGTLAGDVLAVLEESDFSQTAAAVPFEHVTRTRSMLKLWCGIFTATFVSLGVVIPALDREN